eukprot:TRINITY_DN11419_c0_g2_i1.p1 TRINITY_DN11419_c0_g2~~TRINITY_DN11419_c0_g2_i1.p1  ORF type:complete len:283 (-),score=51.66 TRINITY_DN11419_c0_g2_i1:291-1139(-)
MNFGSIPIVFKNIRVLPRHNLWAIESDVEYSGDGYIQVDLLLGGKVVQVLNLKSSITVQDIRIEGKMIFEITFTTRFPFMYKLDCCFVENPFISMELGAQGVDIFNFPGLKENMINSIKAAICQTMVQQRYPCLFNLWPEKDKPNPYGSPLLFDPYDEAVEQLKPSCQGVLELKTIKMKDKKGKKRTCYCVVEICKKKFETSVMTNTTNPQWDVNFTFYNVPEPHLKLKYFEKNISISKEIGVCILNLTEILKNPGTYEQTQEVIDKRGFSIGDITLQLTYT